MLRKLLLTTPSRDKLSCPSINWWFEPSASLLIQKNKYNLNKKVTTTKNKDRKKWKTLKLSHGIKIKRMKKTTTENYSNQITKKKKNKQRRNKDTLQQSEYIWTKPSKHKHQDKEEKHSGARKYFIPTYKYAYRGCMLSESQMQYLYSLFG